MLLERLRSTLESTWYYAYMTKIQYMFSEWQGGSPSGDSDSVGLG